MTFASEPPEKLEVQIQKRTPTGDNNNYAIFKLHYPKPNSIRVSKGGVEVDPKLVKTSGVEPLNTSNCGDNVYFYNNYTIIFVVTEAKDCLITVYLTETVQLTTHFAMNASAFYSNSSMQTKFIDRLSALLGITDQSRVKIVGVYDGSAIVVSTVSGPTANDTTSTQQVSQNAQNAINSGTFSTTMKNAGLG